MNNNELKGRTKAFAIAAIGFVESLPNGRSGRILGDQLFRAGTSVGANYRAACRSKSVADFISKMGTVEEEANESMFWMELMRESGLVAESAVETLYRDADAIVAMTVASIRTARKRK